MEKRESQKIDDFPVLVTRLSGTSAMLSSQVDGPVAHGSMPDMGHRGL